MRQINTAAPEAEMTSGQPCWNLRSDYTKNKFIQDILQGKGHNMYLSMPKLQLRMQAQPTEEGLFIFIYGREIKNYPVSVAMMQQVAESCGFGFLALSKVEQPFASELERYWMVCALIQQVVNSISELYGEHYTFFNKSDLQEKFHAWPQLIVSHSHGYIPLSFAGGFTLCWEHLDGGTIRVWTELQREDLSYAFSTAKSWLYTVRSELGFVI